MDDPPGTTRTLSLSVSLRSGIRVLVEETECGGRAGPPELQATCRSASRLGSRGEYRASPTVTACQLPLSSRSAARSSPRSRQLRSSSTARRASGEDSGAEPVAAPCDSRFECVELSLIDLARRRRAHDSASAPTASRLDRNTLLWVSASGTSGSRRTFFIFPIIASAALAGIGIRLDECRSRPWRRR